MTLKQRGDLEWYADVLDRGVEPDQLERRWDLCQELLGAAEALDAEAYGLAEYIVLHLEGHPPTDEDRPNVRLAWLHFLRVVREAAAEAGLDAEHERGQS